MGANVQPKKDLFRYCDTTSSSKSSNQERRVLISVRFPTPHGWQCIDQGDYQSFWKGVPMESIFPADRSSHKTGAAREEMCFVYLACVQLREKGYLNDHNKARVAFGSKPNECVPWGRHGVPCRSIMWCFKVRDGRTLTCKDREQS